MIALLFLGFQQPRLTAAGPTLIWDKYVAPGLTYRMEWLPKAPLVIHALRVNLASPNIKMAAVLAGKTVYEDTPSFGRETVTQIVGENQALAGVNADFFPFKGNPLNIAVSNGELLSFPYQPAEFPGAKRVAFGWGPGFSAIGFAHTDASVTLGGIKIKPTAFNTEASPDAVTLDSPAVGLALAKKPNSYVVVRTEDARWRPTDSFKAEVLSVGKDWTKGPVAEGTAILIAEGKLAASLQQTMVGDDGSITLSTTGFDWNKATNVVGGAPTLVIDGKVAIDAATERVSGPFADNRHPRTAIGRTADGDIWLVSIDGRTEMSRGATLAETAQEMLKLGCTQAMNLDGGGSTTLNIMGLTLNHPSDGVEREVAEAVVVIGDKPPAPDGDFTIAAPATIEGGKRVRLVLKSASEAILNSQVYWSAEGSAWVDQGGFVHVRRPGTTRVKALYQGKIFSASFKTKVKA